MNVAEIITAGRNIGDVVEHHIFGAGVIESVDAKRGSYTIKFEKLSQPRNISKDYFEKKHEVVRHKVCTSEPVIEPRIMDESDFEMEEKEVESEASKEDEPVKIPKKSANLWKDEEVPHSGWNCVGVEDLGAPIGICEMCGYQIIRYAHRMEHPKFRNLICGCVCAGKMEGRVRSQKRVQSYAFFIFLPNIFTTIFYPFLPILNPITYPTAI